MATGASEKLLDIPACAVEMNHAYSLIHDDLPAMDDDDLRRGRATCHKAFDEATAILAGDALQSLAFEILGDASTPGLSGEQRLKMITQLATASGARGMTGGQAIDLAAVGNDLSLQQLCFQIQDDILDVTSDTATLGKTQGSDQKLDKPTYPAILGLDAAGQRAREQHDEAIEHLAPLGEKADTLRWIANYIIERNF
jgi:geranylgeranyl pyrophosphate synthase